MAHKLRVAVLASGGGTNLQAIIDNCAAGRIDAQIVVVISDVECGALERTRKAGIPAEHIDRRDKERYPTRQAFDHAVLDRLRAHRVELVCLAGYLRIMTTELVEAANYHLATPKHQLHLSIMTPELVKDYTGRMINIHPALLPSFGGKGMWGHHIHQAVLDYGCKVSGCTVHFVWLEVDEGPIILQRAVPVEDDDTPETLAARILPHEHEIYSQAIQLFAEGRLEIEGHRVRILPPAQS